MGIAPRPHDKLTAAVAPSLSLRSPQKAMMIPSHGPCAVIDVLLLLLLLPLPLLLLLLCTPPSLPLLLQMHMAAASRGRSRHSRWSHRAARQRAPHGHAARVPDERPVALTGRSSHGHMLSMDSEPRCLPLPRRHSSSQLAAAVMNMIVRLSRPDGLPSVTVVCDRSFRPLPLRGRRRNGTGAAHPGGVATLAVPGLASTAVSSNSNSNSTAVATRSLRRLLRRLRRRPLRRLLRRRLRRRQRLLLRLPGLSAACTCC